jgi:general stress protein 26
MSLDKARAIVENASYGVLATCTNGQPRVRPMAFVMLEDGRLWSSTYASSGKAAEFAANATVEVCFVDANKDHLRVAGKVNTSRGAADKKRLLEMNPKVGRHFKDEHDPNFVLVEIVPDHMRWTEPGFGEYHDIALPTPAA